jgi:branched-chain amino acid aminotransferase
MGFEFYSKFISSVIKCDSLEVAETAKLLENSFRLVNISFINEFSIFCEKIGIDVNSVIEAAATKPYGFMPFYPSIGAGGHCIPVDPTFLSFAANKVGADARIRLTIFRDSGGFYTPDSNKFAYLLELNKLDDRQYVLNKKGLIIDVYDEVPKPVNILSNSKTSNALIYVLAGIYKNQNALDEVLILNQYGFLCESVSSNVFVVYDRKLYTPALNEGCVAGVMRQVVMRLAKENNIELVEAQINPDILNEADEVFLTNAARGIQWVMGYNHKRYFNRVSKFLNEKLNLL